MRLRPLLFSAALSLVAPAAWAGGKLSLTEISAYLNGMTTARAPFTQVNADGSLSTGTLSLHRPGRARFEYDPPNKALVMAGGGTVVIKDPKSNQAAESYPLKQTPLSIILDRHVNLGRAKMVVDHRYDGTSTAITARDPDHPEYGHIEMMFTDNPVELRKWVIDDGSGSETTVILGALETGMSLGANLFNPALAQERRGR